MKWHWLFAGMVTTSLQAQLAPNLTYDGRTTLARVRYAPVSSPGACQGSDSPAGVGWGHDYPMSVQGLMTAMTALTSVQAVVDSNLVLNVDEPEFMKHPIAMVTEPGCWEPTSREVEALRTYLEKGGFLVVDDFTFFDCSTEHVELAVARFELWIKKVLPNGRIVFLSGTDPILDGFFKIDPGSIYAFCDSPAQIVGIYDRNDPLRRLLVVGNYRATIGHMWRFVGAGLGSGIDEGGQAYRLGMNYLLYGLSH